MQTGEVAGQAFEGVFFVGAVDVETAAPEHGNFEGDGFRLRLAECMEFLQGVEAEEYGIWTRAAACV